MGNDTGSQRCYQGHAQCWAGGTCCGGRNRFNEPVTGRSRNAAGLDEHSQLLPRYDSLHITAFADHVAQGCDVRLEDGGQQQGCSRVQNVVDAGAAVALVADAAGDLCVCGWVWVWQPMQLVCEQGAGGRCRGGARCSCSCGSSNLAPCRR